MGVWRLSVAVRDMSSNSTVKKSDCVTRSQGVCVEFHPESLMTSLGGARTRLGHTARRRAGGNIDASRRK